MPDAPQYGPPGGDRRDLQRSGPLELPGQLLPLHPMTVADVLDGAFRTWRQVFGPVALIVLLVFGPYELLSNLFLAQQAPGLLVPDGGLAGFAVDGATAVLVLLITLLGGAVWAFAASAVISLVVEVDRGGSRSIGRAMRAALGRGGVVVVCLFLLGLAAFAVGVVLVLLTALVPPLGVLMLLTAGPVVGGAFVALGALVVPVAVAEGGGPLATMTRAFWVLRVRFWRTVGITWLMLIVLIGVSLGLSTVIELVAFTGGPAYWAILAVSSLLLAVVQVPVLSLAALLVYLDARILREAFDLDVRVARLAAG